MTIFRFGRLALTAAHLAAAFCAAPLVTRAGDAKKAKKPHLQYRKTYLEALTEARIRNLPVFVSRHKDF